MAAAARASRRKRSTTTAEVVSSCARTLMATRLPMSTLAASYTAAIPPRPISRVMRYLPCRTVPTGIFVLFGRAIRDAARRGSLFEPAGADNYGAAGPASLPGTPPAENLSRRPGRNVPETEAAVHRSAWPTEPARSRGANEESRGHHQAVQARRGEG